MNIIDEKYRIKSMDELMKYLESRLEKELEIQAYYKTTEGAPQMMYAYTTGKCSLVRDLIYKIKK